MLVVAALLLTSAPVRVYVAPLASTNADASTVSLVWDRVLVAAERHRDAFDVVSERELKSLLDTEAQRQAIGCASDSCAAEIADALAAPQLVTGQLGHIGGLWQLTITRFERSQMQVLARVTADAEGDTAEGLLPKIPALVDELFGVAPPALSPVPIVGGVVLGAGALGVLAGAALLGVSWIEYLGAQDAIDAERYDDARAAKSLGENVLVAAWITGAIGLGVAAAGGVVLALGWIGGDE